MYIKNIVIDGFRMFKSLKITFPESNNIIIIGNNGSGKSTVLDGIAMLLAKLSGALSSRGAKFHVEYNIKEEDINIFSEFAKLKLNLRLADSVFGTKLPDMTISISKNREAKSYSYHFAPENQINEIKKRLNDNVLNTPIPIISYYRTNRSSSEKNVKNKSKNLYNPRLYAYENSFFESTSSFSTLQEWFIHEENLENQIKVQKSDLNFRSLSLEVVRSAIVTFLSCFQNFDVSNLRVVRRSSNQKNISIRNNSGFESYLVVSKGKDEIRLDMLSSGEKNILFLISDIARRLFIANRSKNSLQGNGIILIDEIELHLHPQWQRNIVNGLKKTFPNVQFILSTHSPQVLSRMNRKDIIVLDKEEVFSADTSPFGRDSNGILEEIMGVDKRPSKADEIIDVIFTELAQKSGLIDFLKVNTKLDELLKEIDEGDPVLTRIKGMINRKKILV